MQALILSFRILEIPLGSPHLWFMISSLQQATQAAVSSGRKRVCSGRSCFGPRKTHQVLQVQGPVRIFWRPLEGTKTSRSTLTGSTSVSYCLLKKRNQGKTMMLAYGDLLSKFNYSIIHVYNDGEAKISFLALSQFYTWS